MRSRIENNKVEKKTAEFWLRLIFVRFPKYNLTINDKIFQEELLENLEEMFPLYILANIQVDLCI